MKLAFYGRCAQHKCNLEIEDYDINLNSLPGTAMTKWILDITGWYCPIARVNEAYMKDADGGTMESQEGSPYYVCQGSWWLFQGS